MFSFTFSFDFYKKTWLIFFFFTFIRVYTVVHSFVFLNFSSFSSIWFLSSSCFHFVELPSGFEVISLLKILAIFVSMLSIRNFLTEKSRHLDDFSSFNSAQKVDQIMFFFFLTSSSSKRKEKEEKNTPC